MRATISIPPTTKPARSQRAASRAPASASGAGAAADDAEAKTATARPPKESRSPLPELPSGGRSDPSARATRASRTTPERVERRPSGVVELPPVDFAANYNQPQYAREIIVTSALRRRSSDERKIALFCDLENIALGVRDSEIKKFDIDLVLERLLEKGKIIVKKAYADWERYSEYKRAFHEAAIELIDIPQKYYSGKNSADIKMVVDAMDLSLLEGAPRHLRAPLRRQRLLAAGLQAQGEQQVRHRRRREELVVEPPDRQLRRVHLLRGHLARPARRAPSSTA